MQSARALILFFFGVLIALAVAWQMRSVLEIVYVSALFAVVLMPAVQRIMRLKIRNWSPSRPLAILGLVFTVFILLGLFFWVGLPPVIRDMQRFMADLPERGPQIAARLQNLPLAKTLGLEEIAQRSQALLASGAHYLVASAPKVVGSMLDVITALFLCVYFMLEGEFVYQYFLGMFAPESRERLARTLTTAEHRMSGWLLGQSSLMLILGVCSTIAFAILHVRYFFLLGVLMGLFNIVPVAGGVITILLAMGVAATDSWSKLLGVMIFYFIYVQVENAYLTPRIMKNSVDLMGITVIVALLAGTALAGVVGALVSVPTAALVAVLMDEYMVKKDPDAIALAGLKPEA